MKPGKLPEEPRHIDSSCPSCGTSLVLNDVHREEQVPPEEVWVDEWVCPRCEDGIFLDKDEEFFNEMEQGIEQVEKGDGDSLVSYKELERQSAN